MKKITIALLLFFFVGTAFAQDFKKLQTSFFLKKYDDSKAEIDRIMADPKAQANPEAQLWQARVYSYYFADSANRAKYPMAGTIAMNAFNRYMQMDTSAKALKDAGLQVVDQLYVQNFNLGRSFFDRQMWDSSLTYFESAAKMGEYITRKNWRGNNQALDTFTVLFSAYASQNAKKMDQAATYYQMLADKKVGGKEYEGVYEFLTKHYLNNKNQELFNKYLATAKQLYPQQTLWNSLQLAYLEDNASLDEKVKMYTAAEAGGKMTSEEYISYGNMFAGAKAGKDGLDSLKAAQMRKRSVEAFQKAYNLDKNGIAAYNAGIVLNNEWSDLRDRYSNFIGTAPSLKAKREEIDKVAIGVATEATDWLEKAYEALNAKADKNRVEKNSLSTSVKLLTNLFEWKRDKARGKNVQEYDKYNAKFNTYNALIGKI
jgi:hypothetical protein